MKLVTKQFNSTSYESFRLNQSGIKLTLNQIRQLQSSIRILEMLTPAKSLILIDFEKTNHEIKGSLLIKGHRKKFRSIAKGLCPIQVYNLLEVDIKKQLSSWKKTRFIKQNEYKYKNLTGGYAV